MSNISGGDEGSFSSGEVQQQQQQEANKQPANSNESASQQQPATAKKKRNLPGTPDPTAEVVALSPTTLMATNRFVCEICNKGFQRDQNLQLHRRGHNLPWKLRQRTATELARKRVYICPEPSCVHHNPARALGDLTGIKKHYSRKHGEKKWKCDKCSKKYAVQSDWKAHQKTCGTREYKCDCGTIFSRRDSFITHRAFCDALAEENSKVMINQGIMAGGGGGGGGLGQSNNMPDLMSTMPISSNTAMGITEFNNNPLKSLPQELVPIPFKPMNMFSTTSGTLLPRSMLPSSSGLQLSSNSTPSSGYNAFHQDSKNLGQILGSAHMSATALLQKAAQMGATGSNSMNSPMMQKSFVNSMAGPDSGPRSTSNFQSYDNFHGSNEQTPSAYNSPFPNQIMQKNPQEVVTHMFESGGPVVGDMAMYGGMLMGGDESAAAGLFKNIVQVHEGSDQSSGIMQGRNNSMMARNPASFDGENDMTTVDFLGVGGAGAMPNLHEQRMEMEAMNQQRNMQVMHNPFHQQISHGDSDMDKPLYNTF
ncbi:zinc finger protein GAI-ASSOCIATED FACTOR 1-like [Andrographis paniculata]|uniref:zinc finger protein GAI-ASSOCIATED FACTOR 1-like n=1 Tax=Andrographis paniculata TaxID=175694 RepID=UPI0021E7604B|nr:zinc finger protein GAI-ASSOCIATED FACTOR 1-like [Andrographis paniculata]